MKTVRISAKAYDQALRFCNKRRKEQGKKPIKELPAGIAANPKSCPCASTCAGLIVGHSYWKVGDDGKEHYFGMPQLFTNEFDDKVESGTTALPIRGLKP